MFQLIYNSFFPRKYLFIFWIKLWFKIYNKLVSGFLELFTNYSDFFLVCIHVYSGIGFIQVSGPNNILRKLMNST